MHSGIFKMCCIFLKLAISTRSSTRSITRYHTVIGFPCFCRCCFVVDVFSCHRGGLCSRRCGEAGRGPGERGGLAARLPARAEGPPCAGLPQGATAAAGCVPSPTPTNGTPPSPRAMPGQRNPMQYVIPMKPQLVVFDLMACHVIRADAQAARPARCRSRTASSTASWQARATAAGGNTCCGSCCGGSSAYTRSRRPPAHCPPRPMRRSTRHGTPHHTHAKACRAYTSVPELNTKCKPPKSGDDFATTNGECADGAGVVFASRGIGG